MSEWRLVGWSDDSEWEVVYFNLFYGEKEDIQLALDQIAVWRARFAGRIPVAVEATSHLFHCIIQDGSEYDEMKKLSMATALSQFVGLLTERSLKGMGHHTPIHIRAEEMGIPEWVTNLRHEAAHGLLPSHFMLERGVKFALEWLKKFHWDEQYKVQKGKRMKCDEKKDVAEVREELITLLRKCMATAMDKTVVDNQALQQLSSLASRTNVAELLSEILTENNFIPLEKGWEDSFLYKKDKQGNLQLNPVAKSLFKKLFTILAKRNALCDFFLRLIAEFRFDSVSKDLWHLWIDLTFDTMSSVLNDTKWIQIIKKLLEVRAPLKVIEKITSISSYKNSSSIVDFVKLLESENSSDFPMEVLDPDFMKLVENGVGSPTMEEENLATVQQYVPWTLYTCDISNCPLGLMPGQDRTTLWKSLLKNPMKSTDEVSLAACCKDDISLETKSLLSSEKNLEMIAREIDLF